jgi:hypothetical protein
MDHTNADGTRGVTTDDTAEETEPRTSRRRLLRAAVAVPIGIAVVACGFGGGGDDEGDDDGGDDDGGDD